MNQIKLSRKDIELLPNYRCKKTKSGEYSATCPFCDAGQDRFLFWPEQGNYWCRQCGAKGFILEMDQSLITESQREAWKRAEQERKRKEEESRLSALERVARMQDKVNWYHSQVAKALGYWHNQGLSDDTVNRYRLGFSLQCPTYPASPSYVIPYYHSSNLISIRHRLANPNGCGKYRPEFAGLPIQPFNLDSLADESKDEFGFLDEGEAMLVEGEIKAMYLDQVGCKVVGIPGANGWNSEWSGYFSHIKRLYVALDPGAEKQAYRIAKELTGSVERVILVTLPCKPDDFFVKHRGGANQFRAILRQGRIIR